MTKTLEKPDISPDLREVVIQYKGGGYSGCFWEWNFFLVDHEGVTWDIHSSGRDGLDTDYKREDFLENPPDDDVFVYRIHEKADVDELNRENTAENVVCIVDQVNCIYDEILQKGRPLWVECDKCQHHEKGSDQPMLPYHIELVDWHGCGGIASQAGGKLCRECYDWSCCSHCGEYDPTDKHDNEEGMCSYCWADYKKSENLEEMENANNA